MNTDKWIEAGQGTLLHPVSNRQIATQVVELEGFGRIFEVYHYGNDPEGTQRLISAAPDLLAALRAAMANHEADLQSMDMTRLDESERNRLVALTAQIQSAIAKATK